jgi:hypothetical protein
MGKGGLMVRVGMKGKGGSIDVIWVLMSHGY